MLQIYSIGYKKQSLDISISGENVELSAIKLFPDNINMKEVVVVGKSLMRQDGHWLYIPDKTQKKHAYTGYDLIYNLMIPGIKVDRRNGSITTQAGEMSLYINGVKATSKDIENLRPKDILKVEYHDIPTGRYAGEPAVINYITKNYQQGGYVSLSGEQSMGYNKGKYDVSGKIAKNSTSLTVYGGYNYQKVEGVKENMNEYFNTGNEIIHRNKYFQNGLYSGRQHYEQIKLSHDTKKHNLYGTLSFVQNDIPNNHTNSVLIYQDNDNSSVQTSNDINSKDLKSEIVLNGSFYLPNAQELSVRLDGSYSKTNYTRSYQESKYLSTTHVNEKFYSFNLNAFYNVEMKHNNSMYVSLLHFHNVSSADYRGDYTLWQHLWSGETIINVQYMQKIGGWFTYMVNPGVSALNYRLHNEPLQRIWSPRLNSWILCDITSQQVAGIGFGIGNESPDISYFNSTDQTIDSYQIKRGNPALGNTKIYDLFARYQGMFQPLNFELNMWYTRMAHNIVPYYYQENGKIVNSFCSNNDFHRFKVDMSVSYMFSEKLRANANFKYERMLQSDSQNEAVNNYFASLDMSYFINVFTIAAYVKTTERNLDERTLLVLKKPASYGLSVRANTDKWMVEVGVDNLFTKNIAYYEYGNFDIYNSCKVRTSRHYQQTGYIKVAYTFDFGRKTSRDSRDVNTNINSAILKAD